VSAVQIIPAIYPLKIVILKTRSKKINSRSKISAKKLAVASGQFLSCLSFFLFGAPYEGKILKILENALMMSVKRVIFPK